MDESNRQPVQVEPTPEGSDNQTFAVVPSPLIFLGALVIGVGLNFVWPLSIFTEPRIGDVLGLLATLGSAAIATWAFRTMLLADGDAHQNILWQNAAI